MMLDTDYKSMFLEDQNHGAVRLLRARLIDDSLPIILTTQPGDGTRYRFLLVPAPTEIALSDQGRDPVVINRPPQDLFVTVLDGLGSGTAVVSCHASLDSLRYNLRHELELRNDNPCTLEALAHAVYAAWSPRFPA